MADVLEQWMTLTMGYIVKLNTPEVGEKLYDGTVFHDILCKYNIINASKCPAPPRQPSPEVAVQSLVDLGLWFKLLGITHSSTILENAANKDPQSCMRILFELYTKLETQDNTHFLMKQKAAETQQAPASRFTVTKVEEPLKPLEHPPSFFHLEDSLRDNINIVEKYKIMKDKMAVWCKAEMQRRREVVQKWSERKTYLASEFEQCQQASHPPGDPIEIFNKAMEATKPKEEYINVTNRGYVAYLRQKRKKTSTSYVLKMKMQETLLHDLWQEILDDRDQELTEVFQEILLQTCESENKLITTLQKLHDNYKNFSEFSHYVNDLAEEEYSLAEMLHKSNKKLQEELAKERELKRILELHKRLWEEKLRVKRENHIKDCEQNVYDMLDYAIKIAEYTHDFHTEPSKNVTDEWKELFFKGLPILREPRNFINELQEDHSVEKPEILKGTIADKAETAIGVPNNDEMVNQQNTFGMDQRSKRNEQVPTVSASRDALGWKVLMDFEKSSRPAASTMRFPFMTELDSKEMIEVHQQENIKCQDDPECLLDRDVVDCLNNYNLRTYLNTIGPWDLKQWPEIWPNTPFDEKLNVLGYVVHRLLDLKYALPKGPKRPLMRKFQIKAILGKISDPKIAYILESLKDLLLKENVEVIDVSMPVNYCLNIYKDEMEITEVGSVLKNLKSIKDSQFEQKIGNQTVPWRRWEKRPPRYPEKPPYKRVDEPVIAQSSAGAKRLSEQVGTPRKTRGSRKSKVGRQSVARKSKAGSRKSVARKSKVSRKSVSRKSVARKSVARKSMKPSHKKPSTGSGKYRSASDKSAGYGGFNKATQIPSIPDLSKRYKHSTAGKLGKVAFETLAEGKKLNNVLLANMLIEYLKTLDNKKGFVLVNFPISALQANIFEHQFNGLPLQYPVKTDSEVDLFRVSDPDTDVNSHLRSFLDFEKLVIDYVKEPEPPPDPVNTLLAEEEETAKKVDEKERRESKNSQKTGGRKSIARRKSSKRQSAAPRKSKTGRKSMSRKSVSRKSIKRKSVAGKGGKSKDESKKSEDMKSGAKIVEEKEEEVPQVMILPETPKPPLTLEQLNRFRKSEILPRPNKDLDDLLYGTTSYFTSYVHPLQVQSQKRDQQEQLQIKKGPFDQDPAKLLVKEENKTYTIYKRLGLITDFDYMVWDTDTIKRLSRVILGVPWDEDDLQRKPSIELFGVGNLEKVGKGPPRSDSSGSSKGSRASFFENKPKPKFLKLEADRKIVHRKYMPIKPPPPPHQPAWEVDKNEKGEEHGDEKLTRKKSKSSDGSRKSIRRKSRKSVSRKSMKRMSTARKSKLSAKRQSTKRKSRTSIKRKSTLGGKNKSSGKPEYPENEQGKEPSVQVIPKPQPGEYGWTYVNEPIPYEMGYTAATLWECAEYVYLENMEKIFYLLRMHDMKVLPYKEYVKASLKESMYEESEKRHLVTNFQLMLNKVDDDYRHDEGMKHELYVRAKELSDIMTRVAMERRQRTLVKKAELIAQGWVANQVYTLANLYLSMMQVEIDWFVDSLQVLNDYYVGMLGGIPKPETQNKMIVPKNRMANEEEIVLSGRLSSTGGRRRRKSASKSSIPPITLRHSLVIPLKIQQLLTRHYVASSSGSLNAPPEPNPTYPLVSQSEHFKGYISSLKSTYQGIIKDHELGKSLVGKKMGEKSVGVDPATGTQLELPPSAPGPGKQPKRQSMRRQSKRKSTAKRKSSVRRQSKRKSVAKRKSSIRRQSKGGSPGKQGAAHDHKKSRTPTNTEELPDVVDVAKEEWLAAVDYLVKRSEFRLQLIEVRAKKDLDNILDLMKELFLDCQTQVDDQFMKEMSAIDDCMYVFKRAIEEGSPIQPLMVLDDNRFYIDRKLLLFPDPPPPLPTPLVEVRDPYSFTVDQINTLVKKFSQMAPLGVIETPMIEVLNAMAIAGHESGKPTLPSAWAKLDRTDYKEIFSEAFADQTCIDWRNFIINIANLPYPTIEQLQALKREYSEKDELSEMLISREDFENIPLWFENEFGETIEQDLKLSMAKSLIFNMFKINDRELNYYDLLLGYCRAEDPEDGLGMALDLLLDTAYILQPDKCLREDEFEKIHPRKIIDFILMNFFNDLLNLTDNVQLKYLPPLTFPEVFASDKNQFEISEDILRQNKGTRNDYGDLSSTDSETNRPKPERVLYLDDDDEMPAKYTCDKWQMCVPYEIALALILNALNYYALSPIHQHRVLSIEQRLRDLYAEKGTGSHIKAYRLTSSDLFKDLYVKTNIFKKTNITEMVERIIGNKRDSTEGKTSELAKD